MVIWGTIAVVVLVAVVLAIVVDRRRGSTGASRSLDFQSSSRQEPGYDGRWNGPPPGGGGWGGGDGGGGGT